MKRGIAAHEFWRGWGRDDQLPVFTAYRPFGGVTNNPNRGGRAILVTDMTDYNEDFRFVSISKKCHRITRINGLLLSIRQGKIRNIIYFRVN